VRFSGLFPSKCKLIFIFTKNVRILCLSCNVKKSKTTAKLSENSWNSIVLIVSNSVLCEVHTNTVTVSFCHFTWIEYQKSFIWSMTKKNQLSQQTGSRNLTGPKTLPTIWHTYMKLVTKYQISAINSCWEKCDEKYLGRTEGRTEVKQNTPLRWSGGIITLKFILPPLFVLRVHNSRIKSLKLNQPQVNGTCFFIY
jgi:hypothetical protein